MFELLIKLHRCVAQNHSATSKIRHVGFGDYVHPIFAIFFMLIVNSCSSDEMKNFPIKHPGFHGDYSVEQFSIDGGGRTITSAVFIPRGNSSAPHPVLIAVHNFSSTSMDFAHLIHVERFLSAGIVVIVPQAQGWIPQWRGPGITIFPSSLLPFRPKIDDVEAISKTIETALKKYPVDIENINIVGFSQGSTVALETARKITSKMQMIPRRLFLVAGSAAMPLDSSLALIGVDLFSYQPGRNASQEVANFFTRERDQREVVVGIIAEKKCTEISRNSSSGVTSPNYKCQDGRSLIYIYEEFGEHAWPGQLPIYDSRITGKGSTSKIDFTNFMLTEITKAPPTSIPDTDVK